MPHVAVVGGGVTGLAAAWVLAGGGGRPRPEAGSDLDPRVTVLEAAPRLGGKISTERAGGFLVEAAADSFSAARSQGLELVRALGLADRLLPTGSGAAPRDGVGERVYLLTGGRLEEMPRGLALVVPTRAAPVLSSPLLSARGKARLALELVLPRRRAGRRRGDECFTDESVASFVRRRMGGEYLDRVAGPLLAGIHSTPPEELSVEAAFPRLAALERSHRSLILGMRLAHRGAGGPRRERRGAGRGAGSARVSLGGGMGELVDALAERLTGCGVEVLTGRPVAELLPAAGGSWRLRLAGGDLLEADAVILTLPPAAAAGLVKGAAPALAEGLRSIPSASTATVSLGFPRGALRRPLDAAGFLVPPGEGLPVGACTFSSAKFPGRAPEGHALVRAFVRGIGPATGAGDGPGEGGEVAGAAGGGGVDVASAPDDELVELVLRQLGPVLGISAPPVLTRVHRFADPMVGANPQYLLGHCERVRGIEAAAPPGLLIAGCAYHGLGIPDCIASGARAATAALAACR